MNCKKCGKELLPNEIFCPNCGEKVESVEANVSAIFDNAVTEEKQVNMPSIKENTTENVINPSTQSPSDINPSVVTPNETPTPVEVVNVPVEPTPNVEVVNVPIEPTPNVQTQNSVVQTEQATPVQSVNTSTEPVVVDATPSVTNTPAIDATPTPTPEQVPLTQPEQPKKKKSPFALIVAFLVFVIICLSVFIYKELSSTTSSNSTGSVTTTTTTPTPETTTTASKKKTTTVTTTNNALTSSTVSFGGYDFTLPSGYKYQVESGYLFIWNSTDTALYGLYGVYNLSIDDIMSMSSTIISKSSVKGYTVEYSTQTVGNYKYAIFKFVKSGEYFYEWFVNMDDSTTLYGYYYGTGSLSSDLEDLTGIISTASSNGSGTFATISIDDLTIEPIENQFE